MKPANSLRQDNALNRGLDIELVDRLQYVPKWTIASICKRRPIPQDTWPDITTAIVVGLACAAGLFLYLSH